MLPPVTQQVAASWLHISSRKPRLHQRYVRVGKHCCRSSGLPTTIVLCSLVERDSQEKLLAATAKRKPRKSLRPRMNDLLPTLSLYRHLSQVMRWLSLVNTLSTFVDTCVCFQGSGCSFKAALSKFDKFSSFFCANASRPMVLFAPLHHSSFSTSSSLDCWRCWCCWQATGFHLIQC